MIKSFKDQRTAALFQGLFVKSVPNDIRKRAQVKLAMIDAAAALNDLLAPPSNRLEALKGSGMGHHSIRVNDQWRIMFRWADGNAEDVQLIDYH